MTEHSEFYEWASRKFEEGNYREIFRTHRDISDNPIVVEVSERALSLGDEAIQDLVKLLRHYTDLTWRPYPGINREDQTKLAIISALADHIGKDAIDHLSPCLTNKDDNFTWDVAKALCKIGKPALDALLSGMHNGRSRLREGILDRAHSQIAYGDERDDSLTSVLVYGLEDTDGELVSEVTSWFLEGDGSSKPVLFLHEDASKQAIIQELIVRRKDFPSLHFNAKTIARILRELAEYSPRFHNEILSDLQNAAFSDDLAVRERAAKVAREFDVKEFAARVRKEADKNPKAAKQIMRILGGPEATAFFAEMQTEMQEKAIKNYRQSLSRVEDIGLKRWEDLTLQTRRGFYVNMGMSLALFLVGTGVIIWGLWTLTQSDDLVQQIGGAFLSAVAAFATTYSGRFWKDPVEHVKDFSAQQIRQQSAFIGYMHALGELRLAFERDYARDEMSPEAIERHQRLLSEASDRMSKQLSIER